MIGLSTGIPVLDWFLSLLDAWGYLVVFAFTVFENLFVLGSLTPGETVVIAASFVAARGLLSITGVWFASVFGTFVGSNISYWLGRRAGMDSVRGFVCRASSTRVGRLLRIDDSGLDDVREHFHTDGAKTVLLSRFAVGAKNFVPAVAGATRMPVFWFELYVLIGAIAYTSLMCVIGWFVGNNLDYALEIVQNVTLAGLVIFLLFIGSAIYARRRLKRRRARRLSAESLGDGSDEAEERP